jgi:hypothetical protein
VPYTSCSRWRSADTTAPTHYTDGVFGSSGAEGLLAKTSLYAASWPSDRPMLSLTQGVGSSGAEEVVLARLCLDSNWASDRPTVSSVRPSNHPVLLALLLLLCNSSGASGKRTVGSSDGANFILPLHSVPSAPTLAPMVPLVHPTVSFSFLFFTSSTWIFAST